MKGRIISKREGREIIMATIIMKIMKVINNKESERNKKFIKKIEIKKIITMIG